MATIQHRTAPAPAQCAAWGIFPTNAIGDTMPPNSTPRPDSQHKEPPMRLGAPIPGKFATPDEWTAAVKAQGYSAAYCPVGPDASPDVIAAYAAAARHADIVIAEVGAWSNPLSGDDDERAKALRTNRDALALADAIGANCCVNITGSRGTKWDGHDPRNFTDETFDMIVRTVQSIIDKIKPANAFYTLETMPWMYPDSTGCYLRLVDAIGRDRFAVHFDPVNLVSSPQLYYATGELIRDFVARLGPQIKSCHAKDILMHPQLTTHLDEARPGAGGLDYPALLTALDTLDPDLPLMLEHLPNQEEYDLAAEFIRTTTAETGVTLR